ncbi:MAG: hypothetical protein CVU57_16205 [Deltaproteobacteria bacterium HGW-Deltaproteobacteria-15]|jgi:5S rRNA maturation endonuclease (ribonuclease M5)|nr:MAG: hypothetical protein CVU57_16205 [Deltaproteobacteria bacterium HGW-Deltaproteobacteria-15]
MMSAAEYIRDTGFEHKEQGGQIVLKTCPYCGDQKSHFYMDPEEGAFFCHKCNERGNLITLKKHLGDFEYSRPESRTRKPAGKLQGQVSAAFPENEKAFTLPDEKKALQAHERLLKDPEALSYVTEARAITRETAIQFKLGLQVDGTGSRWLTIPHYEKGNLINIKSRSLPPAEKAFRRVTGARSILFNSDCLQENTEEVYIAEGELDAITLHDRGITNVVSGTTGAGAFDPAWIDQLAKLKRIILCYDPDEAGQKGARELARRIGYDRCVNVVLSDSQDVNDFFASGKDIFDFQVVVNEGKKFDVAGIVSFKEALLNYCKELERAYEAEAGIRTGWPSIDRIIKTGFMPGELVVLSAPPKIGKSTFALQVITHNALQGLPSLFFCLEMRPRKVTEKIIQCQTRKPGAGEEIDRAWEILKGMPLYLGFSFQKPTLEGIMETLKAAVRRYGLKLVCFDHLHFLCRSINNQVQEVGLAVQSFKFLAEEMEVPIILIAQPRKIQANEIMTAMDLKDSSSIFSDCDHLIILHRQRKASRSHEVAGGAPLQDQAFEPQTLVRVEASRYNPGGEALLYFHGEYSRFDEIARN